MNMMYCAAIGEYNKQVKEIVMAMGAYQLNFEDAAERLGIKVTPKHKEIYNRSMTSAFEKLDNVTATDKQIYESLLA